jgi:hypothetical protein
MPLFLMLVLLATTPGATVAPNGAIETTIRGTAEPVDVELLLRNPSEEWVEVEHKRLPADTRHVRFEGLASGIYQLLVKGPQPTQQAGAKVAVGTGDTRQITIAIEPFALTGQVTLGGTPIGEGAIVLRHRELHWTGAIRLDADGTFHAPLWQRGEFTYFVRGPALPTDYAYALTLDGPSPAPVAIDIPDGRITGIVRDGTSNAPVSGALVTLHTVLEQREENVRLTTGPDGRFDFTGIKHGRHTVQVFPPQHLQPEPIVFQLSKDARLRELDVPVDPGRAVPILVIDRENDPVAGAKVFAVTKSKLRARATTDDDGRATIAVPAGETATLFVVPKEGPFGMLRVAREGEGGRLQIYLPRTSSSLVIRAVTTNGTTMPPFSLLMRYNGEIVPPEIAEELSEIQGLQLMTGADSEAHLQNIPSGSYEFWPYRSDAEAASIVASATTLPGPIQVNVLTGENEIAVKFNARAGRH